MANRIAKNKVLIPVEIEKSHNERLKRIAENQKRSRNNLICIVLEEFLKNTQKED